MAQTAKKQPPQGEFLSISDIAKRCGIHRSVCAERLDALAYEPAEGSNAKLKLFWFDDEMEFAVKSAKDTASALKIRGLRLDNEIKANKLAEARGDLVDFNEITGRVHEVISRMYKEFALHQPKRLAARLARATTAAEVQKILKLDTAKVMSKLRESDESFVPICK